MSRSSNKFYESKILSDKSMIMSMINGYIARNVISISRKRCVVWSRCVTVDVLVLLMDGIQCVMCVMIYCWYYPVNHKLSSGLSLSIR